MSDLLLRRQLYKKMDCAMISSLPLKEIMSRKLITLHPKDKMARVQEIFENFSIHHIPIVVSGDLVGIISKSDLDLLCNISKNNYDKFVQDKILKSETVDVYMKTEVYALTEDNTIGDAIEIFLANELHCLPVVEENEIIGMVTPYDILKFIHNLN